MANPRPNSQQPARSSPITPRRVVVVLLIAAAVAFVVQNTETTQISWTLFQFDAPLWLLTIVLLVIGFVIGWFVGRPNRKD